MEVFPMRGLRDPQVNLLAFIDLESRVPPDHPLRTKKTLADRALTALSLLFGIYQVKPSPFCVMDEVDAPLDDANVDRFVRVVREFSKDSQFIVVTHNKQTMAAADCLHGVTMEEPGVSKLVSVQIGRPEEEGNGQVSEEAMVEEAAVDDD